MTVLQSKTQHVSTTRQAMSKARLTNTSSAPHKQASMKNAVPVFPLEIFELTLDELHSQSDHKALSICAAVCRAFAHRCRVHLFRRMKISTTAIKAHLIRLSGQPHAAPYFKYVRSLSIMCSCTLEDVVHLSAIMPNVEALEFATGNVTPVWSAPPTSLVLFSTISTLDIRSCTFPSLETLQQTIDSLPQLSTLKLQGVRWHDSGALPNFALGQKLHLTKLILEFMVSPNATSFLEWLLCTPIVDTIRVLDIADCAMSTPVLLHFLARVQNSLDKLSLRFRSHSDSNVLDAWRTAGLRFKLTSLDIGLDERLTTPCRLALLVNILENSFCQGLRRLRLRLDASIVSGGKTWVEGNLALLEALDVVLQKDLFRDLHRFNLVLEGKIHSDIDPQSVTELVMKHLPNLRNRAVLVEIQVYGTLFQLQ
ncbi:uncharacterized protein FIBRA_07098 [Fibroporia radiculosa]|uniref:F-box domain-containing protein n=1 Tax=Fibroporia radiculosa TaxID=599839 RepID=J4I060_9APHY|nr:uncharacterized protein FIBRA_07098 [Fibroporia radiculosa]CCM04902.1 predicted protein [Fibroporia radiculosa]